jgi:hypothetical protein
VTTVYKGAYSAEIHPADEEGDCLIVTRCGDEVIDRVRVRSDQAAQWARQEVEVLADPRVYGVDLPEEALMDADERRKAGR